MILIACMTAGSLGYLAFRENRQNIANESATLQENYYQKTRSRLRADAEFTADLIRSRRDQARTNLDARLRNRVQSAHAVISHLFKSTQGRSPSADQRSMIAETLRPMNFGSPRAYLFILDMQGNFVMSGFEHDMAEANVRDYQDMDGVPLFRKTVEMIQAHNEGFLSYRWSKPGEAGKHHMKRTYVMHFEPLDWIIGLGEYLEDYEAEQKAGVLADLNNWKHDANESFFICDWNGQMLTGAMAGENLLNTRNNDGRLIYREMIEKSRHYGGFYEYASLRAGSRQSTMLVYLRGIADWQWCIGYSANTSEIEDLIERQRKVLNDQFRDTVTLHLAVLGTILLLSLLLTRIMTNRLRDAFDHFNHLFDKGRTTALKINEKDLPFSEFREMASNLNLMIQSREAVMKELHDTSSQYRELFNSMSSSVVVHETHDDGQTFIVRDINSAALTAIGKTRYEVIGKNIEQAFTLNHTENIIDIFRRVWRSDSPMSRHLHYAIEGESRWADMLAYKLPTGLLVAVFDDVSERRRKEIALRDSEERYRLLLHAAQAMSFELDLDGTIRQFDSLAERVTGYRADQVIGKCFAETFLQPEFLTEFQIRLDAVADGNELHSFEARIHIKDGFLRQMMFNAIPRHDAEHRVVGILATGQDLTELRLAQQKQRESEHFLHQVLDSSLVFLFSITSDGRIQFISENIEEMIGVSASFFMKGSDPSTFVHPDDRKRFAKDYAEAVSAPQKTNYEYRFCHAQTEEVHWFEIHITPVEKNRKEDPCLLGIGIDITSRKTIEAERNALSEQIRQGEKLQAIGQLAGGIAHDFNNLLGGIIGAVEMIRLRETLSDEGKRQAEMILEAASVAGQTNRQLMSFARKGNYQSVPIEVGEQINKVVDILMHTIDKRITVIKSLNASGVNIQGDPGQIQTMLLNLALNARDAMPDGGELTFSTSVCEIDAKTAREYVDAIPGRYLRIRITDTGSGIAPENMKKVFEPYFTTKAEGKGTGLGLASVFGIVKSHRGFINVESTLNRGTTFSVYLPAMDAVAPLPSPAPMQPHPSQGAHILVVDDEYLIRKNTTDGLKIFGHQVVGHPDGMSALEYFREHHDEVDLVVLDLAMPGMSGKETLEKMHEIDPTVKAILTSGYSEKGAMPDDSAGVVGFMQKPVRLAELADRIEKVLNIQNDKRDTHEE